jgi:hypothetical protein
MVAIVHLVTLGWISASILGVLYMLGPMVLRAPMPRRTTDLWAFWSYAIGTLGMASHFWLDEPQGMVWSAGMVLVGLAWVGWRFLRALASSPLEVAAKVHFFLAFLNVGLAGLLGALAGIDKFHDVLSGYVLHNVYAHAHLAALGWATLMVMGAGYRLLPMFLPAALPRGRSRWWSAILMEAGVLALAAAWLSGSRWLLPGAASCLAGLGVFFRDVIWMLRHRRPAPQKLRRPDWGTLQSLFALVCLAAAAALAVALVAAPDGAWKLRAAAAYGVLGLVGFLSQMVVGIGARLLPLYAWLRGFGGRVLNEEPPSPHELTARPALALVLACWVLGVPGLATGLVFDSLPLLSGAATLLALGTLIHAREEIRVLRLFRGDGGTAREASES